MSRFSGLLNPHKLGAGHQTLVLSHGFGSDQSCWRHLLPWLTQHYQVVVYDLACAGTVADKAFDVRRHSALEGYVEDLLRVLDGFEIDRCLFFGHSLSGMIGLLASIKQPQRFQKLIMMGTSPRYLDDVDYIGGFNRATVNAIFDAIDANFRDWARNFAPVVVAGGIDDAATLEFTETLISMRPDIALATARAVFLGDWRGRLAACSVPSVILQSQHDHAVPRPAADYLHRHLDGSVLEVMGTEGHLPHLSDPHLVLDALRRYLPL